MAEKEEGTPAKVEEIVTKTGVYGELNQVMCKILEGSEEGRVLRRNVKGPIQEGDTIVLLDTSTEAKKIQQR